MMVSTRGRYAMQVIIDLAENAEEGYIPMKAVSARQNISLKYLERILPVLTQNRIVEGVHGKGGGYKLCRKPEEYTVLEILELTEGDLAPVSCVEKNNACCENSVSCRTYHMWDNFYHLTNNYFKSITVRDLMNPEQKAE